MRNNKLIVNADTQSVHNNVKITQKKPITNKQNNGIPKGVNKKTKDIHNKSSTVGISINPKSIKRIKEGKVGIINYNFYHKHRQQLIDDKSLYQNKTLKKVSIYKNVYKEPFNVAEIHGFTLKSVTIDDTTFFITKVIVSNGQSVFIKVKKNDINLTVGQEIHVLCKLDTYLCDGIYSIVYIPYRKLPYLATFKNYHALYPSKVYFTGLITNKNFEQRGEDTRGFLIVSQITEETSNISSDTLSILRFPCIILKVHNKFNYKVGDVITLQGEPFYDIYNRKLREIGIHLLTCKKA